MTDTRPPVPPIEGHYAKLRNGIIELIGPPCTDGDKIYFKSVHFNFKWLETGKSTWDDGQYDIVALISPEAMQSAASGEVERLRAAIQTLHDALLTAAQAVLKYAEDMAPKPIESAPKNKWIRAWNSWDETWDGITVTDAWRPMEKYTHWLPLESPPTQTPAVFTDLAAAVEGVR